jgi:predicted DsbA family dithiol-disulfide isomerase
VNSDPCISFPIELVLYGDVVSPWCWLAEKRIAASAKLLDGFFAPLRHAPYPLRPEPMAPSPAERRASAREVRKAAKQPDGAFLSPDLWTTGDAPAWSLPALVALAAARLQGEEWEQTLREKLREAALVTGLNVSRHDVLIEVAARAGLQMDRFVAALHAPATERAVREDYREAIENGVELVPALVIGDDWLVCGAREAGEYLAILRRYLETRSGLGGEPVVH